MSSDILKEWNQEHLITKMNDIPPHNWGELKVFLETKCNANNQSTRQLSFPLLQEVLEEIEEISVFEKLIPFLWDQASKEVNIENHLQPSLPVITMKKSECLSVLSKAFFCLYQRNSYNWQAFPSMNFDRLYMHSRGFDGCEKAKLQMIISYFVQLYQRHFEGNFVDEEIEFSLSESKNTWLEWQQDQSELSHFFMEDMYKSLDDAKDDYRIDFANTYLGGASLSYGSVQEEIMFSICPEMNVGRLFSPRMKEHQAICIKGTEQFTTPQGYGHSLEFGGLYKDHSMVIKNKRQSFVVAIDALDFRGQPTSIQYTQAGILRELNKFYAAMSIQQTPSTVATGNWGCGVFGGNAELKLLIQWVSASRANKNVRYFPFDNKPVYKRFLEIQKKIQDGQIQLRVCDMIRFFANINARLVFRQFEGFLDEMSH